MRGDRSRIVMATVAAWAFVVGANVQAQADWPCFRGPNHDGVSTDKGLPLEWSSTKNLVWMTELPGAGASSPITFGDRIYLTCYSGYGLSRESRGRLEDLRRHLVCLSREDGRILWDKPFASMVPEHPYGDYVNQHGYASSTPAADETGVYTFFGVWGARAYDHDGTLKWERSCGTRYTNYGSAASPVLVGDLVVINAAQESQAIVALDKRTGREVWRVADPGSYSTPLVVKTEQGHELVLLLPLGEASHEDNRPPPGGLVAVDPRNGNKLWQCISVNANLHASPIASEGIIYAVCNRAVAIRAGGRGDVTHSHLVWQVNQGSEVPSPIYHEGYLYWVAEDGIAHCIDAKDGAVVYKERLKPSAGRVYASGVLADGKIYYVSRENGTYVVAAAPRFTLLAHNTFASDGSVFNGSPAISRKQLLLRSDKYLYCVGESTPKETSSVSHTQQKEQSAAPAIKPKTQPQPLSVTPTAAVQATFVVDEEGYKRSIEPFLQKHCLKCHGPDRQEAGLRVDEHLPNDFLTRSIAARWSEVLDKLNAGVMPPEKEPQPVAAEVTKVTEWIAGERLRGEKARRSGSLVLRRLNRAEYNNTVRELTGVDMQPADEFPADPTAGGFDNNGEALTISPLQLELYVRAARRVLDRAIVTQAQRPASIKWRIQVEEGFQAEVNPHGGRWPHLLAIDGQRISVSVGCNTERNGMIVQRQPLWNTCGATDVGGFRVPQAGQYVIRLRAAGRVPPPAEVLWEATALYEQMVKADEEQITDPNQRRNLHEYFEQHGRANVKKHFSSRHYRYGPPRVKLTYHQGSINRILSEFDVPAPESAPAVYEARTWIEPGGSGVAFSNVYHLPRMHSNFRLQAKAEFPRPELLIDWVEVEGPVYDSWPPSSHRHILLDGPQPGADEVAHAQKVLARFMTRAYRRPLRGGELESKLELFRQAHSEGQSFEEAIKRPLVAVLSSPHFLFLAEATASTERDVPQRLSDFELATRLSYFLWSSMPDDELSRLAGQKQLASQESFLAQADRLLADERSEQLVKNFAGQWLKLRDVGANPPSQSIFLEYDDHLESSMRGESEAYFSHILRNDLNVRDFIRSDFVTINERMARFYGIPDVKGDHFRAVKVPEGVPRGGVLTQASMLSVTSNGTRTSPVLRGVWVLERLLGDPPAPPPPNAGQIPPKVPGMNKATVRERLRIHREQPQCANCHNKIDPLGFALENFDASGQWREREAQGRTSDDEPGDPLIDARAQLPGGAEFVGVEGLQNELLKRQDQFLRCLVEKLYAYALGRELAYADEPTINCAVEYMKQNGCTLRSAVHCIVTSDAFRSH